MKTKLEDIKSQVKELEKDVKNAVKDKTDELKLPQNTEEKLNSIQKNSAAFNKNKVFQLNKSLAIAISFGAVCGGISPTNKFLRLVIGMIAGTTAYSIFSFFNKNTNSRQHDDKPNQNYQVKKCK